ncbi:cytochrome P450 [Streptomyces sp. HGB0020]|uniref:cytochrome P450 n=1 Tax=Streptomyces sp. HGB0020 TaxID=1078086 RepID=UPI00034ECCA1|nr:cytochrome P450 [Streptomyces sp. HGB0020]EPD69470.1 hypothetical protein HMPREF1211_00016 [Streptomyces sp. HGB0020]
MTGGLTPTEKAGKPTVDFDHHSREYVERGVEITHGLREKCPVAWSEQHGGYWVATRHDDVTTVFKNDEAYSSENWQGRGPRQGVLHPPTPHKEGMMEEDPPAFIAYRKPLTKYFSQPAIEQIRPEIEDYASWAIDQVIESGEAELVMSIFAAVPALLTNRFLGLPLKEATTHALAMQMAFSIPPDGTPEDRAKADQLFSWSTGAFRSAAAERRKNPTDDLISLVANLRVDGELLDMEEVVGNSFLLMSGGISTTTALLANVFTYFDEHPETREWIKEDYSRLKTAGQEFLRYFSPVQGLARTATRQCTLGDVTIEEDERIWMAMGAANRDPEVFPNPDELDLKRSPNKHVAFGVGMHRCMGSHMAMAMFEIVTEQTLRRMPDLKIDRERSRRYQSTGVLNGWAELTATFTPGKPNGSTLAL